jgi:nucleoside-diphosphate-sugar epimerase
MSRVLVTGATGFIGRRAVTVLRDHGYEVHAIARRPDPSCRGITWHRADLLEPRAATDVAFAARASHLLHLAWYAVPGLFWTASENERWVTASLRFLDAFATAGGERAVMAGTCAEYGWDGEPLDERHSAIAPSTLYGRCKDATRRAASELADRRGISLAWGRIFFVYGPGEHPSRLVSSVARALVRGERVSTTEGSQVRDFLHVDDVARAFAQLLESGVEGPVNIASGEPRTVREVVTLIATAAGGLDRVDFGALPIRTGDPARIVGNPTRLTTEVSFRPAIALPDGLAATVGWWRESIAQERMRRPDSPPPPARAG